MAALLIITVAAIGYALYKQKQNNQLKAENTRLRRIADGIGVLRAHHAQFRGELQGLRLAA